MQALTQCAARSSGCTMPTCSPARAASARPRSVAHPGQEPELHRRRRPRRHHRRRPAACARPAPRSTPTATWTTSSSTPPATAASTRSATCIERAAYKPGIGRFKVFMIDEAHQLTKDAFNALLKTLEEPPEYLKFVLATTDPEKMLPTVLSRCLQFNLRPMAPEVVREHLQQVLQAEGVASRRRRRCACWRARRAARCAMRCRSPTRPSPTAAASSTKPACAPCSAAVDRGHARCAGRGAGAARRRRPCWRRWTACAAWACRPPARWRRWPCCCSRWRWSRRCPARWTRSDPDLADGRAPGRRCWRPTRRSCSTASCCTAAASCSLMTDEYGALTMVLLRLLAFPPAAAARCAAAAPTRGRRRRRREPPRAPPPAAPWRRCARRRRRR